jgi:AraC-like DNA-binding protein
MQLGGFINRSGFRQWGGGPMSFHPEKETEVRNGNASFYSHDWERVAKDADFRPAKMASLCSISERHMQRVFKKYLQCTPSRWLRDLQCRLAKELISQGYSSKAAAAELKFATEAHFCREFKKAFGASPQSYAPSHVGYLRLALLEKSARAESRTDSRCELGPVAERAELAAAVAVG